MSFAGGNFQRKNPSHGRVFLKEVLFNNWERLKTWVSVSTVYQQFHYVNSENKELLWKDISKV
jgi:hypothetical protein